NRKSHLQALDRAIEQGELFREFLGEQNAFSTQLDTSLPKVDNFSSVQLLKEEKELVGIYLSSHPIEAYRLTLTNQGVLSVHQAWKFVDKGRKRGCALIQSVREIRTKDGKQMAFL